jgi:hypothetical protein
VHRFRAVIKRVGILYCVDLPAEVSRALGARGYVRVRAKVAGRELRTTAVPSGRGRHRIFLDDKVRRGAKTGDEVAIALSRDDAPEDLTVPDDLAAALDVERVAEAFAGLSLGKRREILRWIEAAAKDETRRKRVLRAVEVALASSEENERS